MTVLKLCVIIMVFAWLAGVLFAIKEGEGWYEKLVGSFIFGMIAVGLSLFPVSILVFGEMAIKVLFNI